MIPKTLKEQLKKEFPFKIELHAHSYPVSRCGKVSPSKLVDIYHGLGFDGLVLTNHFFSETLDELPKDQRVENYLAAFTEARDHAAPLGMRLYLGAELRFDECVNDYLLYGVDEELLRKIPPYFPKGLAAFRGEVPLLRSVLLQAHPFRKNMTLADPALLDGIETYNMHCGHNNCTPLAARYAAQQGFTVTAGGSDFHQPDCGYEGAIALRARTLPEDSFALAALLKSGDFVFELGGEGIIIP